jgi:hypothetical protein
MGSSIEPWFLKFSKMNQRETKCWIKNLVIPLCKGKQLVESCSPIEGGKVTVKSSNVEPVNNLACDLVITVILKEGIVA